MTTLIICILTFAIGYRIGRQDATIKHRNKDVEPIKVERL